MDALSFSRLRFRITVAISLAIWSLLIWQQAHGGVPSHSFLARDDMPSITNWWGALLIPALTWFLTGRVAARVARASGDAEQATRAWQSVRIGFLAALGYAAALAAAYMSGRDEISGFLFQLLPFLGLVAPIFRAEYVLGFVLGLTYSFGAVLPTIIATVMSGIGAIVYLVPRAVIHRVRTS